MPFEIDGLNDSLAEFDKPRQVLQSSAALEPFAQLGERAVSRARALAPEYEGPPEKDVVAGALGDGIFSHPYLKNGAPAVLVGTNGDEVPYASDIEFGNERQAAQPFLRPAFEEVAAEAEPIVADGLGKLLG